MTESIKALKKIYNRCLEEKKQYDNLLNTKPNIDKEYINSEIDKLNGELNFIKEVFSMYQI